MPHRECVLYMTTDCTLCDEALDMLLASNALTGVVLTTIDIADDDSLFREYGDRIPVFACNNASISWPFSADQARSLIS